MSEEEIFTTWKRVISGKQFICILKEEEEKEEVAFYERSILE